MDLTEIDPPRVFKVGEPSLSLRHCADLELAPDEQVTLTSESGTEFDIVRKSWGYYGTPSLNRRLPDHGLRPALALSRGAMYLLLVEAGNEDEFAAYLDGQSMELVAWLDTDEAITDAAEKLRS